MGILTVEVILPEQWGSSPSITGTQRLAIAITERAMKDLEIPELKHDAESWLKGTHKRGVTFDMVQGLLGISSIAYEDIKRMNTKLLRRTRDRVLTINPRRAHESHGTSPFVAGNQWSDT